MSSKALKQYELTQLNREMTLIMRESAIKTANNMSTEEFFTDTLLVK